MQINFYLKDTPCYW